MALTDEGIIEVPGMLSRWVRLGSGCKAHYMTSGETGPAVILMHGGLIGARGMTVDEVKLDASGHVRLLGETWLAVTADGSLIPPSTAVIVTSVVGTTLTVRAAEEYWELT